MEDHHPPRSSDLTTWAWDQCHILTVVLTVLYAALLVAVCVQLARIVANRHKLLSFHAGFNSLVALWMLLRTVFFLSLAFPPMPPWANRVLYWPAINVQFATYSLLVCFFVSYVYRDAWSTHVRKRVLVVFVAGNTALLGFTFGWIIAAGDRPESEASNEQILAQILFNALVFVLLTVLLAVYGWMYIARMSQLQARGKSMGLPQGGTLIQVRVFYVFALCVFSSRYIYSFAAIGVDFSAEAFGVENKCLPTVGDFFVLLIWELLPTTLLVIFFRRIPSTQRYRAKPGDLQSPLLRNHVSPAEGYLGPPSASYTPLFAAPADELTLGSEPYSAQGTTFASNVSTTLVPDGAAWGEASTPAARLLSYESSSSGASPRPPGASTVSR